MPPSAKARAVGVFVDDLRACAFAAARSLACARNARYFAFAALYCAFAAWCRWSCLFEAALVEEGSVVRFEPSESDDEVLVGPVVVVKSTAAPWANP